MAFENRTVTAKNRTVTAKNRTVTAMKTVQLPPKTVQLPQFFFFLVKTVQLPPKNNYFFYKILITKAFKENRTITANKSKKNREIIGFESSLIKNRTVTAKKKPKILTFSIFKPS